MIYWFLITFSGLFAQNAHAAACCGGGYGMPSLITGDERAQLTSVVSYSEVKADVYTNGLWRKRDESESTNTVKLEGAHIFLDRWQAGFSVPAIQRQRVDQESTGLGDISGSLGYEYLPDWTYSEWRPKGVGYLQLTAPTGKSIYESDNIYALDSRGRGFWSLGVGTILNKTWRRWDGYFNTEVHYAMEKQVRNEQVTGTLKPGFGNTTTAGLGYNLRKWRVGGSVAWTYEDPIDIQSDSQKSQGSAQRFTTGSLIVSYLANADWSATASYSDQTLFGSPVNTSLSKTVAVQLQRRWAR